MLQELAEVRVKASVHLGISAEVVGQGQQLLIVVVGDAASLNPVGETAEAPIVGAEVGAAAKCLGQADQLGTRDAQGYGRRRGRRGDVVGNRIHIPLTARSEAGVPAGDAGGIAEYTPKPAHLNARQRLLLADRFRKCMRH